MNEAGIHRQRCTEMSNPIFRDSCTTEIERQQRRVESEKIAELCCYSVIHPIISETESRQRGIDFQSFNQLTGYKFSELLKDDAQLEES